MKINKNKKSKRRSVLVIFLAGAMSYAIVLAGLNLFYPKESLTGAFDDKVTTGDFHARLALNGDILGVSRGETIKSTVSIAEDCTQRRAGYDRFRQVIQGGSITVVSSSIGIKGQAAKVTNGPDRPYAARWDEDPIVVNYKCEVINFSELGSGDMVSIYLDKSDMYSHFANTENSPIEDVRLIQRVTR